MRLFRTQWKALFFFAFALDCATGAIAASSANSQSALGVNLNAISYYSPELPFLNILHSTGSWITSNSTTYDTGEEASLQLDANGWPTSLVANPMPAGGQAFTFAQVLLNYDLPTTANGPYPAGQYVVLYEGQGTMIYTFDAKLVSSSPGRDVINVAQPSAGISLRITSTDPNKTGNYIRNIRVVQASLEGALAVGQVFNPTFLNAISQFHVVRFMDWLQTNNNPLTSWANRPLPTNAFYGTKAGAPIEVAVQLANAISADAWLNVPAMADDNYITQYASLVHSLLGPNQKVYVEYSNETWNYGFSQAAWIQTQAQALWPTTTTGSAAYTGNRNWYGMRVAQICDIWKSVWGADASRVNCVMAAQGANTWTATTALNCTMWTGPGNAPCASHGISMVAIGGYFGGAVPVAWTSSSDGGLSQLFAAMTTQNDPSIPVGGWIGETLGFFKLYKTAMTPFNLPVVVYEGGSGFVGAPKYANGTAMVNLFNAANRDPRMATAYTSLLQGWESLGGQTFMQYDDVSTYGQYGEWGALDSIMETTSPLSAAPPKWQAISKFISSNPCWWSGCTGAAPLTPAAPTGVTIQ